MLQELHLELYNTLIQKSLAAVKELQEKSNKTPADIKNIAYYYQTIKESYLASHQYYVTLIEQATEVQTYVEGLSFCHSSVECLVDILKYANDMSEFVTEKYDIYREIAKTYGYSALFLSSLAEGKKEKGEWGVALDYYKDVMQVNKKAFQAIKLIPAGGRTEEDLEDLENCTTDIVGALEKISAILKSLPVSQVLRGNFFRPVTPQLQNDHSQERLSRTFAP